MSFEVTAWAIRRPIVNKSEKLILIVISDCLNSTTSQCNPSLAYICEFAACSRNCAIAGVKALEKQGYITVTRQHNKSNAYKLITEASAVTEPPSAVSAPASAASAPPSAATVPPEVQSVVPEQGTNQEVIKNKIKDNKYRKLDISEIPEELLGSITEFIDHRINLKKPLTQEALSRFLINVFKAAEDLNICPTLVINETIDAGWQSIKTDWLLNRLGDNHAANKQFGGGGKPSAIDRLRQANDCTDLDRQIADAEAAEALEAGMDAPGGDLWPPAEQPVWGDNAGDLDTPPERVLLN